MKYRRKSALHPTEIMIVIVLIGLIGSVIGVNMKGSLDEGRAFKTRQAQEQIADILMLEVAQGTAVETVVANPQLYLDNSGLVKNGEKFLKDGWGGAFVVTVGRGDQIIVKSERLKAYDAKKKQKLGNAASTDVAQEDENS